MLCGGVNVEGEGAFLRRERQGGGYDQRSAEFEVADAEDDGGEVEELGEGRRACRVSIAARREGEEFGEVLGVESIGEGGDAGGSVEGGGLDGEGFGQAIDLSGPAMCPVIADSRGKAYPLDSDGLIRK